MSDGPVWENKSKVFIKVLVKPNSKSKKFVDEVTEYHIVLNLRGPAREGKANTELIKRLAKILGISTASLRIVAGHRSREKTLQAEGINMSKVLDLISRS